MSHYHSRKKQLYRKIAQKRIQYLYTLAEESALEQRLHFSNRYVHLARKLSMRYLVSIPQEFKRKFCKHCYSYLLPSINCRVRIHRQKIITYCYDCQKYSRFPLKKR